MSTFGNFQIRQSELVERTANIKTDFNYTKDLNFDTNFDISQAESSGLKHNLWEVLEICKFIKSDKFAYDQLNYHSSL